MVSTDWMPSDPRRGAAKIHKVPIILLPLLNLFPVHPSLPRILFVSLQCSFTRRISLLCRRFLLPNACVETVAVVNMVAATDTRLSLVLCGLWAAAGVGAHVVVTYPGWRGNNLITNETFPYGTQWLYPCAPTPLVPACSDIVPALIVCHRARL